MEGPVWNFLERLPQWLSVQCLQFARFQNAHGLCRTVAVLLSFDDHSLQNLSSREEPHDHGLIGRYTNRNHRCFVTDESYLQAVVTRTHLPEFEYAIRVRNRVKLSIKQAHARMRQRFTSFVHHRTANRTRAVLGKGSPGS